MNKVFNDLTGKKFGRLEVLFRVENKNGKIMWRCRCICGNNLDVKADRFNLKEPHTRSCGCLQKEKAGQFKGIPRTPTIEKLLKDILGNYKRRAKKKDYTWGITNQEFENLIQQSCYYCGIKDSNKATNYRIKTEYIMYNGIDRMNPSLGYEKDNIVTCCNQCNYAKLDFSKKEFLDWIKRVYNHNKERS